MKPTGTGVPRKAQAPQYTPVVEELLARVSKLEELVGTLLKHQHQYHSPGQGSITYNGVVSGQAMPHTTRPVGLGSTSVSPQGGHNSWYSKGS